MFFIRLNKILPVVDRLSEAIMPSLGASAHTGPQGQRIVASDMISGTLCFFAKPRKIGGCTFGECDI